LWTAAIAHADSDSDCNGNAYCNPGAAKAIADGETASHAAASAVRRGFNGIVFLRGLAMFASPRNAYCATEEDTRSAESLFSLAQIA
jgi:hypothetical protein